MNVERLISDLARDITTVEPRADFSARVLDRIDAFERRGQKLRLVFSAAGLVAAAALAVFIVRGSSQLLTIPAVAHPGSGLGLPYVNSRPDPNLSPIVSRKRPASATSVTATAPSAEDEWLARAVPALEATKPITIEKPRTGESIQPASLQIPLMGVDVIGTDPLSIAPIGSKHE